MTWMKKPHLAGFARAGVKGIELLIRAAVPHERWRERATSCTVETDAKAPCGKGAWTVERPMPTTRGNRVCLTTALALLAWLVLPAPTPAAPPPPPSDVAAPPGVGDPPPPLADASSGPVAGVAAKRFQFTGPSAVELAFLCNTAFNATLGLRTGQERTQRSSCDSDRTHLTFRFGASLRKRLREFGVVHGALAVKANGVALERSPLTITRHRVVIESSSVGRAAATSYWPGSQAWMSCANLSHPTDEYVNLRWHTYDGSVRWIWWRVWIQAYFTDGDAAGWHWKSPDGWNTSVPWYGPYRMNGYGIVEFQQDQGGAFSNEPFRWRSDVFLSYHYYTRAVAQLWVWTGTWNQGTAVVPNDISTSTAPGWCDYT